MDLWTCSWKRASSYEGDLLYFKYFTLLSSCLCGFWEVRCNACLCFPLGKVLFPSDFFQDYFSLSLIFCSLYDMPRCSLTLVLFFFIYPVLSYHLLVFSKLPGSVVWYLNLIWGHSQSFLLQKFFFTFPFFFSPSSIPIHMLHLCNCSILLRYSISFFPVFLLLFFCFKNFY